MPVVLNQRIKSFDWKLMDNNNAMLAQDILDNISIDELFDASSAAAIFFCWTQLNLRLYFGAEAVSKTSTPMRISYRHSDRSAHRSNLRSQQVALMRASGNTEALPIVQT